MWRFLDRAGTRWDVALGRESWGVLCALFVPSREAEHDGVRQVQLAAKSEREAVEELDGLEREGWHELLDRSLPKD